MQFVLFYEVFQDEGDWHLHVLAKVKNLTSKHAYFATGVLTTLFHIILAIVKSAVFVVNSPG